MIDDLIRREDVWDALNNLHGVGGIYLWDPEKVLEVIEKAPRVGVMCEDCEYDGRCSIQDAGVDGGCSCGKRWGEDGR